MLNATYSKRTLHVSSFLLGLLMSFLTQSKFSNLILTLAKVRTRYRGIQTWLTKAINFPLWVKFTSLVVPLFDLRLNTAIAMPRGPRLVTRHPQPLFPPNNPQNYIFFSYFLKRISHFIILLYLINHIAGERVTEWIQRMLHRKTIKYLVT